MSKKKSVEVTNGGGFILKQILPQTEWYKGIPLINAVEAQEVWVGPLKELNPPKSENDLDAWADKPLHLVMSTSAYLGIKACLKFYLDNAGLSLQSHALTLIEEFGILEE
ncbi:MAG: hypothetical protein F6K48_03005 [Okeania sp. SIO3H1]|nr:hypothetical protein [Okeania sp. SIO3H1]